MTSDKIYDEIYNMSTKDIDEYIKSLDSHERKEFENLRNDREALAEKYMRKRLQEYLDKFYPAEKNPELNKTISVILNDPDLSKYKKEDGSLELSEDLHVFYHSCEYEPLYMACIIVKGKYFIADHKYIVLKKPKDNIKQKDNIQQTIYSIYNPFDGPMSKQCVPYYFFQFDDIEICCLKYNTVSDGLLGYKHNEDWYFYSSDPKMYPYRLDIEKKSYYNPDLRFLNLENAAYEGILKTYPEKFLDFGGLGCSWSHKSDRKTFKAFIKTVKDALKDRARYCNTEEERTEIQELTLKIMERCKTERYEDKKSWKEHWAKVKQNEKANSKLAREIGKIK